MAKCDHNTTSLFETYSDKGKIIGFHVVCFKCRRQVKKYSLRDIKLILEKVWENEQA